MFTKTKYQVIAVDRLKPLDESGKDSVPSLQHHPGFQYLVGKLRLQAAALKANLERNRHSDIREVDFLQSGIAWLAYLEHFVDKEVYNLTAKPAREATEDEAELFRKAAANLDLI